MFRYVVPVDDEAHEFALTCNPVTVAATPDGRAVEFWAENYSENLSVKRWFRVFGTGHEVPVNAIYIGTASRTPAGLVWHLYEVPKYLQISVDVSASIEAAA